MILYGIVLPPAKDYIPVDFTTTLPISCHRLDEATLTTRLITKITRKVIVLPTAEDFIPIDFTPTLPISCHRLDPATFTPLLST